jgi:hypothetical protein
LDCRKKEGCRERVLKEVIIKAKQNRIFIAKMTLEESLGLFYNPFI